MNNTKKSRVFSSRKGGSFQSIIFPFDSNFFFCHLDPKPIYVIQILIQLTPYFCLDRLHHPRRHATVKTTFVPYRKTICKEKPDVKKYSKTPLLCRHFLSGYVGPVTGIFKLLKTHIFVAPFCPPPALAEPPGIHARWRRTNNKHRFTLH